MKRKNDPQRDSALNGLRVAFSYDYNLVPLELAAKACDAAVMIASDLGVDADAQAVLEQYQHDLCVKSPTVVATPEQRACLKNKTLDCLIVKGNVLANNLIVCGTICGSIANCDPRGTVTGLTGAHRLTVIPVSRVMHKERPVLPEQPAHKGQPELQGLQALKEQSGRVV